MSGWVDDLRARLDELLGRAVAITRALEGSMPQTEPFRGLYVTAADAERLSAGELPSLAAPEVLDGAADPDGIFERLGLDPFERGALALALAPELGLRYERVLGFLQDDVTRRRPTVELVLALLCADGDEHEKRRPALSWEGRLVRNGVIVLVDDRESDPPCALGLGLSAAPGIVGRLFGGSRLDRRLRPVAELDSDPGGFVPDPVAHAFGRLTDLIHLHAADHDLVRSAAAGLAAALGRTLLRLDVAAAGRALAELAPLALRDARLEDAVLLLEGVDAPDADGRALADLVDRRAVPLVLGGTGATPPALHAADQAGTASVAVPPPRATARAALWDAALAAAGIELQDAERAALGRRFRLSPILIHKAADHAGALARGRAARPVLGDVLAAAHAVTGTDLARLTTPIAASATWEDLVAPEDTLTQLRELCDRIDQRDRVLYNWDLASPRGRGVTALFAGPTGTGKTMAAEVVATELGLPLARIELARVVSKYIGETEKNLDEIFAAAARTDAILLFDEADALFGKRSQVRDAHDRYANLEVAYLLQRMEDHDGLSILATNLRRNIDDAFVRRLAFAIHFPFPAVAERRLIWGRAWPSAAPRAQLDLDSIASEFALSGGGIRNAAVAAAFAGAADGGVIRPEHVLHAIDRERAKLGAAAPAGAESG